MEPARCVAVHPLPYRAFGFHRSTPAVWFPRERPRFLSYSILLKAVNEEPNKRPLRCPSKDGNSARWKDRVPPGGRPRGTRVSYADTQAGGSTPMIDEGTPVASEPGGVSGTAVAAMVVAAVQGLAAFAPWATMGVFSTNGIGDGSGDGWLLLVVAILAAIGAWKSRVPRDDSWMLVLAGGIGGVALCVWKITAVNDAGIELFGETISPSVGWGLWLGTVASAALLTLAVKLGIESREAQRITTTKAPHEVREGPVDGAVKSPGGDVV